MFKVFLLITGLLSLEARTCFAQAQEASASEPVHFNIRTAVDTSLPAGILAVTLCDTTNQPIVIVRSQNPTQQTLVHEAVHVMQVERNGGCPDGWMKLVHDRISLVNAEAEATCVEAYWTEAQGGENHRKIIQGTIQSLLELSKWRAKGNGPEWELTPGEIAHAFNQFCPEAGEPRWPATGTTTIRKYPERKAASHSPLTGR